MHISHAYKLLISNQNQSKLQTAFTAKGLPSYCIHKDTARRKSEISARGNYSDGHRVAEYTVSGLRLV